MCMLKSSQANACPNHAFGPLGPGSTTAPRACRLLAAEAAANWPGGDSGPQQQGFHALNLEEQRDIRLWIVQCRLVKGLLGSIGRHC
ncbi:hypothetical protein GCM10027402_27730 [Arthrobacter monumenti]